MKKNGAKMAIIQLELHEIQTGAGVGIQRQVENMKLKRNQAHGHQAATDWQSNIEGVLSEMALSKHWNLYWKGKGNLREPDVGNHDCRSTPYGTGHLLLHKEDPDERRYYLLIGVNGRYEVAGWCYGMEGKLDEYWKAPQRGRPCYMVPQTALRKDL
jgi:hypothetical protein